MRHRIFQKSVSVFAAALVAHMSVLPSYAQTLPPWTPQAAAGLALSPEFQPDISDLYSSSGPNSVDIDGVTMAPAEFYSNVNGLSASQNQIPAVSDYQSLYAARDAEIANMATSQGNFSYANGSEQNALTVLNSSVNIPSVKNEAFLFPGRTLISDPVALRTEFGECKVTYNQSSIPKTYTSKVTNTCEVAQINQSPMYAARSFYGPNQTYSLSWYNGQPYCTYGGTTVAVSDPNHCAFLAVFTTIPPNDSLWNCTNGTDGCLRINLKRGRVPPSPPLSGWPLGIWGPVDAILNYTSTAALCAAAPSINRSTRQNCSNYAANYPGNPYPDNFSACTNRTGSSQRDCVRINYNIDGWGNKLTQTAYNYLRAQEEALPSGVSATSFNIRPNVTLTHAAMWSNTEAGSPSGVWIRYNSANYSGDAYHLLTPIYPGGNLSNYFDIQGATNQVGGTMSIEIHFKNDMFSPWTYSQADLDRVRALAQLPNCSIQYTCTGTADPDHDGCVYRMASTDGSPGGMDCGGSIPYDPMWELANPNYGMNDRACTSVTYTPNCTAGPNNTSPTGGYQTLDNCTEFANDPECSFVSRTCLDTMSDGSCYAWDYEYSCGTTTNTSIPTETSSYSCTGDLSCMGTDCVYDGSTNGTVDLADTAAKLASLEMMMADMQCTADISQAPTPDTALNTCTLFNGKGVKCQKIVLGIANCCKEAKGVSLVDYLTLAFAAARLNSAVYGLGSTNAITSAWVSLNNAARDSFSSLTQPLVESWESIIGNSGAAKAGAQSFSIQAVKQTMMKKVAEWTYNSFGSGAANSLFSLSSGAPISGSILPGETIGFSATLSTVMSAISVAYTVYVVATVLASIWFACSKAEIDLGVKKALRSTHYIGTYCSTRWLGQCVEKHETNCVFSSPLSRIMNEQIRAQLGQGWGTPKTPDCHGFAISDLNTVNMDAIDLSEWTGMMLQSGMMSLDKVADIDKLTGQQSTLGQGLSALYTREDAVTRNLNRYMNVDLDANRGDAVNDFGSSSVVP